jgi:hypothetical protein
MTGTNSLAYLATGSVTEEKRIMTLLAVAARRIKVVLVSALSAVCPFNYE